MTVDPRFERHVLAEFGLRERRAHRSDGSHSARLLAQRLHGGSHELLGHLRRVADAVPPSFRSVAWLHRAGEARVTPGALTAAGLTTDEVAAIDLLAQPDPAVPRRAVVHRARRLSKAPGTPGYLARVVARAAIEDGHDRARPDKETVTALLLLPDPRLTK